LRSTEQCEKKKGGGRGGPHPPDKNNIVEKKKGKKGKELQGLRAPFPGKERKRGKDHFRETRMIPKEKRKGGEGK